MENAHLVNPAWTPPSTTPERSTKNSTNWKIKYSTQSFFLHTILHFHVIMVRVSSRVNFAVCPLGRSVALWEGHQLQHVEGIFPAPNILLNVLNPTSFSGDQIRRVKRKRKKNKNVNDVNESSYVCKNNDLKGLEWGSSPKMHLSFCPKDDDLANVICVVTK